MLSVASIQSYSTRGSGFRLSTYMYPAESISEDREAWADRSLRSDMKSAAGMKAIARRATANDSGRKPPARLSKSHTSLGHSERPHRLDLSDTGFYRDGFIKLFCTINFPSIYNSMINIIVLSGASPSLVRQYGCFTFSHPLLKTVRSGGSFDHS